MGCGEKPAENGETTADSTAASGDTAAVQAGGVTLETVPMQVGQWISFGVDTMPEVLTFAIVAEEQFQGVDCVWLQIQAPESEGTVVQLLIDPALITASMQDYSAFMNDMLADPQAFFAARGEDAFNPFADPESMQKFLDFIASIKMMKVEQNGAIMGYDLSGLPAVLQPVLSDTLLLQNMQAGMSMDTEGIDSLRAVLDEVEYEVGSGQAEVGGTSVGGTLISMTHPRFEVEVMLSSDLPILPLAYARVVSIEDNETHLIEARAFGDTGAENLMPGTPAQVTDVAPMVQMMITQMQAQMQQQGAQINQ
jgi:hypothetical protein